MPSYQDKIDEIKKKKLSKEAAHIMKGFLNKYGKKIIETTTNYKKEHGQGALFITLIPNSEEFDMEFFTLNDLDGIFRQKIQENPDAIHYAIRLYDKSYRFMRKI